MKKEREGRGGSQRDAANEAEGEIRESQSIRKIQPTSAGLADGGRRHELRNMDS